MANVILKLISKDSSSSLILPMLPEKISVKDEKSFYSYDLYQIGEAKFPAGNNLQEISWDSTFPGEALKGMSYVDNWTGPEAADAWMRKCQKDGTKLHVYLTSTSGQTPINDIYLIQTYSSEHSGAFGSITYGVSLIKATDVTIKKSSNGVFGSIPKVTIKKINMKDKKQLNM